MEKLRKQIEDANDDIKKTEKMLDVDLFLKQQKKKKMEYAKQLNADYEIQKKIREEKLYKKFRKKLNDETNVENNNNIIEFKSQNIMTTNPKIITKFAPNL
jgi:hypothetical protein